MAQPDSLPQMNSLISQLKLMVVTHCHQVGSMSLEKDNLEKESSKLRAELIAAKEELERLRQLSSRNPDANSNQKAFGSGSEAVWRRYAEKIQQDLILMRHKSSSLEEQVDRLSAAQPLLERRTSELNSLKVQLEQAKNRAAQLEMQKDAAEHSGEQIQSLLRNQQKEFKDLQDQHLEQQKLICGHSAQLQAVGRKLEDANQMVAKQSARALYTAMIRSQGQVIDKLTALTLQRDYEAESLRQRILELEELNLTQASSLQAASQELSKARDARSSSVQEWLELDQQVRASLRSEQEMKEGDLESGGSPSDLLPLSPLERKNSTSVSSPVSSEDQLRKASPASSSLPSGAALRPGSLADASSESGFSNRFHSSAQAPLARPTASGHPPPLKKPPPSFDLHSFVSSAGDVSPLSTSSSL